MSLSDLFGGLRRKLEARVETSMETKLGAPAAPVDVVSPWRWGWGALWAGFAAFVLWAFLAPLGQGVPAHGFVKVAGNRKTIQHQRGGVVEAILVKDGQHVEADQPLIRLNPAQAQSQQGSIDSQLMSLLAVEARLNAERLGADSIVFPEFLTSRSKDLQAQQSMEVQRQLFRTRRAALQGEISIHQETILGLEQQISGLQAQERSKAQQLKLYTDELAALKPLYDQGFVPRNRMFDLERAIAFLNGGRSEDIANIGRVRSQIGELKLKMLQVRETYRKEVETMLTDVQRSASDYKERRVATQDELERVVLKAPEAGTIVEMAVFTVGGVVGPGQKLMDLVPQGSQLEVEVQIPPHLIDTLRTGQEADLHFTALDQTLVPAIPGRLTYLAADRQTDPRTDQSYFVGRIQVTPEGLQKLGKQVLLPGMPADAVIKTGERTLVAYLLKPFMARMQSALTER